MLRSLFKSFGSSSSGSTIEVPTIGSLKSGLMSADHQGWIILNGRAKSTLTTTQQTAATSLGIGANLPDARDRALVGTSGTKPLSTSGGNDTLTLARNQLPDVNVNIASFPVVIGGNDNTDFSSSGLSGIRGIENATSSLSGWPVGGATGTTTSINGGVTQQPTNVQNPYLSVNHFLYLGL